MTQTMLLIRPLTKKEKESNMANDYAPNPESETFFSEIGKCRFKKLGPDQVHGIAMPAVQMFMFGVQRIDQNNTGRATLYYTDGTTESALLDYDIADKGGIHVIGDVQERARRVA